jgi:hypothetical protein
MDAVYIFEACFGVLLVNATYFEAPKIILLAG